MSTTTATPVLADEASLNKMLLGQTPVDTDTIVRVLADSALATVKEAQAFDVLATRKGDITEPQVRAITDGLRKTGAAAAKLRAVAQVVLLNGVTRQMGKKPESYTQIKAAIDTVLRTDPSFDLGKCVTAVASAVSASPRKGVSYTTAAGVISALVKRKVATLPASKQLGMSITTIKGQSVKAADLVKAGETVTDDLRNEIQFIIKTLTTLLGESK